MDLRVLESDSQGNPGLPVRAREQRMGKLKVLPDNKILVVGVCDMFRDTSLVAGKGVCMMRFNSNGTLDTTFGTAGTFTFAVLNNPNINSAYREYPGMVWTPVGNQPMIRPLAKVV